MHEDHCRVGEVVVLGGCGEEVGEVAVPKDVRDDCIEGCCKKKGRYGNQWIDLLRALAKT